MTAKTEAAAGMRPTHKRVIGISEAEAALVTFEEAVSNVHRSLVERDGAIFRLIFTFAVASKACGRLLAVREDIEVESPKAAIRGTRRLGWLSDVDAEATLAAGRDRKLAFEMYRPGVGDEIASRLTSHAAVLRCWLDALRERAADST